MHDLVAIGANLCTRPQIVRGGAQPSTCRGALQWFRKNPEAPPKLLYREGQAVCPLPHRLSCVRDESLQDVSNGINKHQTRVLSLPMRMCERAHARTIVWVGACRINPACCAMSTLHRHDWRSFEPAHVGTPLPPFYIFALSFDIPLASPKFCEG